MPTYDYQCRKCQHRFEVFHGMKDEKPRRCPRCKGRAVRVPSAGAGLLFKGSGFYITDHRSSSYQKKADQERSSESGGKEPAAGGKESSGGKQGSGGTEKSGGGKGSAKGAPTAGKKKRPSED